MIVWCENCRHHLIIEEGDPLTPMEGHKRSYVDCPACKEKVIFPLKTEE